MKEIIKPESYQNNLKKGHKTVQPEKKITPKKAIVYDPSSSDSDEVKETSKSYVLFKY